MKKKKDIASKKILGIFSIYLIASLFYLTLILFDNSLYSLFKLNISENIQNLIFIFQQDLIFFPAIIIFGLFAISIQKENKKEDNRLKKKKIVSFLLAFVISLLISLILKQLIYKPRPNLFFGGDSFPSGHATGLFSLVPFLNKNSKPLKIIYVVFIAFIFATRFVFGYHYLSDLFFGAIVGYSISFLIKSLFNIKKWK